MKDQIKKALKLLLLLTILALAGCEKDLYEENLQKKNRVNITFEDFKKETNLKDFKPTFTIPQNHSLSSNKDGEGNYEITDFNVNTDEIKKLDLDTKVTYAFRITPKIIISESIYNLIVYNKGGNWEMSVLELIPTDFNLQQLKSGQTTEFKGTIRNVYDSAANTQNNIGARVVIVFHCPGGGPCQGGYCDLCLDHCLTIVTFDEPRSFGITYEIPGDNGTTTYYNPGGGGTDDEVLPTTPFYNDPTGYAFDPNLPPIGDEYYRNKRASEFWDSLLSPPDNIKQGWANNHPDDYCELIDYYLDNYSQENENFVNEVINRVINDSTFTSVKPLLIEKKIYDAPLDPCFKGVLTKLKNASDCDISKVLAKLDANNSVYKTVVKNEDFSPIYPAQTSRYNPLGFGPPLRYNYIIQVHTGYNSSTKLFKASILLHELIHAYFFSLNDDFYTGNDFTAFDDFPSLFQKFVLKTFPGSTGDAHHNDMALIYVDALGRALQEYHTGNPVPENEQPLQVYTDLAWGGLGHAPIFNTIFPEGSPERERVLNRYACEGLNQQTGNEIPIGGNPCNE